jgi:hypothetical protein
VRKCGAPVTDTGALAGEGAEAAAAGALIVVDAEENLRCGGARWEYWTSRRMEAGRTRCGAAAS